MLVLALASCSAPPKAAEAPAGVDMAREATEAAEDRARTLKGAEAPRPAIRDVYLSPGDEIRILVYGQPALSRQVVIPPDGRFFFPMVGELDVAGLSVRELRQAIATGLAGSRAHRIVPGDELAVRVHRRQEFSTQAIVPQDGKIVLPMAGEVEVGGLTLAEARLAIVEKLSQFVRAPEVTAQIVRYQSTMPIGDPQVSVDLVRLTGEKFFVLGEVRAPGVFALSGTVSLLDAIGAAGGLLPNAKAGSVLLITPGSGRKKAETREVSLNKSLKKGDLSENPILGRGDVVFVPETGISKVGRFFNHVGNIVRPFVDIETGIWLGQNIDEGPADRGGNNNNSTTPTQISVYPR